MAAALLERETLGRPEIEALMEGRDLPAHVPASPQQPPSKVNEDSNLPLGLPNRKSEVA